MGLCGDLVVDGRMGVIAKVTRRRSNLLLDVVFGVVMIWGREALGVDGRKDLYLGTNEHGIGRA